MRRSPAGLGVNTQYLGWGIGFLDFDLDGWPDLCIVNGHVYPEADRVGGRYSYAQRKLLYRNLGNGRFEDVSHAGGSRHRAARRRPAAPPSATCSTRGRMDVVVNNMHDAPTLLHDCAPAAGHSLVVKLEGTRSNRSAIGARVMVHVAAGRLIDEVRSGGSFCSQNDLRLHFGLGTSTKADRIEVAVAVRRRDAVAGVAAGQVVIIREGAGLVGARRLSRRRDRLACP